MNEIKQLEKRLAFYRQQTEEARRILRQSHGIELDSNEFNNAVRDALGIVRPDDTSLLIRGLTSADYVKLLRNYSPPVLIVEMPHSILSECIPVYLPEDIRQGGEQWRIQQNDKDPYPSNPHAHNLATGYKLHLGNGELYQKKHVVANIGRKNLCCIRCTVSDIKLSSLEVKFRKRDFCYPECRKKFGWDGQK